MEQINFMPWRQSKIKQQRRKFFYLIGGNIIILLLFMGLVQGVLKQQSQVRLQRIHHLMAYHRKFESETRGYQALQLQRKSLLSDLKTVHDLSLNQRKNFMLIRAVFRACGHEITMTRLNLTKNHLRLNGCAVNVKKLNQFVKYLKNNQLLTAVKTHLNNERYQQNTRFVLEGQIV